MPRPPFPTRIRAAALLVLALGAAGSVSAQDHPRDLTDGMRVVPDRGVRAERLLVRSMTRQFLGDLEGARELLRQAVDMAPESADVHAALARVLAEAGRDREALLHATEAVQLAPDRPDLAIQAAELAARTGDAAGAMASYDALVDRFPGELPALLSRARLLAALEQRTAALAAFRDMRARWHLPDAVLEEHIEAASVLGEHADMIDLLSELRLRRPWDGSLARRQGETLTRMGRPDDAVRAFREAAALDPSDAEARAALVDLVGTLVEAGDGVPDDPLRRIAWARVRLQDPAPDRLPEILAALRGLDDPEALWLAAAATRLLGQTGEAADLLLDLTRRDARRLGAWQALLEALRGRGDAAMAVNAASEARLYFPGDPLLALQAGAAALDLLRPGDALDPFRDAVLLLAESDGDPLLETAATTGLALAHLWVGRTDEASALLETVGGLLPGARSATSVIDAGDPLQLHLHMAVSVDLVVWLSALDAPALVRSADRLVAADDLAASATNLPSDALARTVPGRMLRSVRLAAEDPLGAAQLLVGADSNAPPAVHLLAGDLAMKGGDANLARQAWSAGLRAAPGNRVLSARLERR